MKFIIIIIICTPIGIDLTDFMSLIQFDDDVDIARRNRIVYRGIKDLQDWFTALEKVSIYSYSCSFFPV